MNVKELDYQYPEHLVATERIENSRVMFVGPAGEPSEVQSGVAGLVDYFQPGDVLVLNDTKVLKRRVFSNSGLEILFLNPQSETEWEVLCPSTRWKQNQKMLLPDGVELEIISRGRPQRVKANRALTEDYFQKNGELPLPPYIQKARDERHNRATDETQYQTAWAEKAGSLAAPTASLHFKPEHIEQIKARGVKVVYLTLHVGIGTFLPITVENLDDHTMHAEQVEIPAATWAAIEQAKTLGSRVWALGTTVTRSLESVPHGKLQADPREPGAYFGETNLFIRPGFDYRVVDVLLTNFHQPQSTLMALVGAFAGLSNVKRCYEWAIEREFRLFSYGDLSAWIRKT